ncbi:MAG: dihydropteroate synthase, partial [Planctomyces sp.]
MSERCAFAESRGISPSRIWIDPGIGFGKTTRHNLELLKGLSSFVETGYPVLVGVSRKAFIGKV